MNEEIVAPPPGRQPTRKPVIEPLRNAKRQALSSSAFGNRLRMPRGTGSTLASSPASTEPKTSPIANTPIATTITSIPPSTVPSPHLHHASPPHPPPPPPHR